MTRNGIRGSVALGAILLLAGCGGGDAPAGTAAGGEASAAVEPTGTVHEIKMISGSGERFEPGDLVVKRGDVLRFVLVAGVHNASFPADKNPAGVKLPAATPYLQAPGQTHDMVVDLPPGEYYYHCDPHVALGMNANLTVVE